MAGRTIKVSIDGDVKGLTAAFRTGADEGGRFNAKMTALGASMTFIGSQMTSRITAPIVDGFSKMVGAASDFNETQTKVGTVFGDLTADIRAWSETSATALGQSKTQALDAATGYALLAKNNGLAGKAVVDFAKEQTQLSADFASFFNTSPDEAIIAIGAAYRGESEPIRRYGITLSEATIKARALSEGIVKAEVDTLKLSTAQEASEKATRKVIEATKKYGAGSIEATDAIRDQQQAEAKLEQVLAGKVPVLTEEQKLLARRAEIMAQSSDAQGDFARTSDGLANSQKILKAEFENLQIVIGTKILPVAKELVAWAREAIGWFSGLSDPIQTMIIGFAGVAAAVGPLLVVVGSLVTAIGAIGLPVLAVVAGLAALAAALVYAYRNFEGFRNVVDAVGRAIVSGFGAAIEWLKANVPAAIDAVSTKFREWRPAIEGAISVISSTVLPVIQRFVAYVRSEVVPTVLSIAAVFRQGFSQIVGVVGPIMSTIVASMRTGVRQMQDAWDNVKAIRDIVNGAFTAIKGSIQAAMAVVTGLVTAALRVLRGDFSGAFDALKSMASSFNSAMGTIFRGLGQIISGALSLAWAAAKAAFSAGINAVVALAKGMPGKIVAAFGGLPALLTGIGRNAMAGLLNGISSGAAAIYSKIEGIASNIKSKFAGVLQIFSPSRVFHEFGVNITQGLTNGIGAGQAQVTSAVTKLSESMTAAIKGKGNPSAIGADFIRQYAAGVAANTSLPASAVQGMADKMKAALEGMKGIAGKNGDAVKKELEKVVQGIEDLAKRMESAIPTVLDLTRSSRNLTKAQKDEIGATEDLNEARAAAATISTRLAAAEARVSAARDRGEEGASDLAEAERDLEAIRKEAAESPKRIADALDRLTDAQDRAIDAQLNFARAQQTATAQGGNLVAMFQSMAAQAGLSQAQIANLTSQLYAIPDINRTITITTVKRGAEDSMAEGGFLGNPDPSTARPGDSGAGGGVLSGARGFAAGGYFPARAGGYLGVIGEGYYDEVVAPEPMLREVIREESGGGGTTIIVHVAGSITTARGLTDDITAEFRRAGLVGSDGTVRVSR
jgi:phage-related protein